MTAAQDRLRREGRADAAVLLVARRVVPTMVLTDWARHLDLDQLDLTAAVDRLKGRVKKPKRPGGGSRAR